MLPTQYQQFIHLSRYSRYLDQENRRETWGETVGRYFDFMADHLKMNCKYDLTADPGTLLSLHDNFYNLDAVPSMRAVMTAGKALSRDHVSGYNCAFTPIDNQRAFDEIMFILMCGTGVGFSVERQYVNNLPYVLDSLEDSDTVIIVRDSKRGWCEALRELIGLLYSGRIPKWDTSRLRAAGARLKTMGGRSSGPEPLEELFRFIIRVFVEAQGRQLTSIECHDIACKVGDVVVVGGVRRSAMLSLSNLSDQRMRDAKAGQWWEMNPQRALANNSIAFTEKPDVGQFLTEWQSLYSSKSGERGIFNTEAAWNKAVSNERRSGVDAKGNKISFGTNPCSEIILRPKEFCNLSEVIARSYDDFEGLRKKIEAAAIFGTWQSTLTNFRYLGKKWRDNCEEERLLGVSITGIMDCPLLNGRKSKSNTIEVFEHLKQVAVDTNKEWAEKLGINPAAAITCVKPSGTVSQLADCASGIHSRFAKYYIRRVRQDIKDPVTDMMIDMGFPHEQDVMNPSNIVFEFPMKAPVGSVTRDDRTAIEELEHWKLVQDHWCEHKPSVTINVRENEWPGVGAWVWDNFDNMSGVSFLPYDDHSYRQAPYEKVEHNAIKELESKMPTGVDWTRLSEYEKEDTTTGTQELACVAGVCEV
jgi:ribonucleoside-diphosphate reductase alpha chain